MQSLLLGKPNFKSNLFCIKSIILKRESQKLQKAALSVCKFITVKTHAETDQGRAGTSGDMHPKEERDLVIERESRK